VPELSNSFTTSQPIRIRETTGDESDVLFELVGLDGEVVYNIDKTGLVTRPGGGQGDETDPLAIHKSLFNAAGDLIVASANDTPARLAIGASGTILGSGGTTPAWVTSTDAIARTNVKIDGASAAARRTLNFVSGEGVGLAFTDDPTDEEIDILIASTATIEGSGRLLVAPIQTSSFAVSGNYDFWRADTTAGAINATLPTAAGNEGLVFGFKKSAGGNAYTLLPPSGATYESVILALTDIDRYWRLGETSGTAAAEETGAAGSSTYTAGFTLNAASLLTGDSNPSVELNGTTGRIVNNSDRAIDLSTGDWTMMAWVNLDAYATSPFIFAGSGSNAVYSMRISNSGQVWLWLDNVGGATASTGTITTGATYHVAMTWEDSANRVRYYINGSPAGDTTYATAPTAAGKSAFYIGAYGSAPANFLDGRIDEPAILTSRLTDQQVADVYEAGITGAASQTIEGGASLVVATLKYVMADGANWIEV
jgi:hypothetical protein